MLPNSKVARVIDNLTASTGGTQVFGSCDRLEYDFASFDVYITQAAATTVPQSIHIGHADVTTLTSAVDITGFASTDITMPVMVVGDQFHKFNVDCRALDRYLFVEYIPGASITAGANVNLFRADEEPITAAGVGAGLLVSGPS